MKQEDIFPRVCTSLEVVLNEGAQSFFSRLLETEVAEYLEKHQVRGADNRRVVKRNGYLPERDLQTGIGAVTIKQPRVRGEAYSSAILQKYSRRAQSVEALIPTLYLKGISAGNMQEALSAILGKNASGLSTTNIVRLKKVWEKEHKAA